MKTYRVKNRDMVDPFEAKDEKEAATKALKILGFSYGSRVRIERDGPIKAFKDLGYELEII